MTLSKIYTIYSERVRTTFDQHLARINCPSSSLQKAMLYSLESGGKQLRPLLVYLAGLSLNTDLEKLDAPACAIELLHTYSLIHDDLPAMDNADLRRGKPTCHKAFNEAFAILAGDGLQTLAFEVLATHPADLSPLQRIQMVKTLAHASGFQGMAAGQALDLEQTDQLLEMYSLKTGALLVACVQLASIAANAEPAISNALESYAFHLGLAYQLQDDLLDDEPQDTIGKSSGLDVINEKKTYSTLFGKEKTRAKIAELHEQALASLHILGTSADMLRDFAHTLLQRKK